MDNATSYPEFSIANTPVVSTAIETLPCVVDLAAPNKWLCGVV